jgi:hypothetical protein
VSIKVLEQNNPQFGDGDIYEIFPIVERPKKKFKLRELRRGKMVMRGFIPNDFLPKENGKFLMAHHMNTGLLSFGALSMASCKNVREEDGMFYFETPEGDGRYLIVPCQTN